MHYLLTGGAGFIGSHLAERLLKDGHSLTILDDLSTGREANLAQLRSNSKLELIRDTVENPQTNRNAASTVSRIEPVLGSSSVSCSSEVPAR